MAFVEFAVGKVTVNVPLGVLSEPKFKTNTAAPVELL
jgi:hypothetical protein